MSKPLCVVLGPIGTRSGYGEHTRDLVRSLLAMDRYTVKTIPARWGNTPMNSLTEGRDQDIIDTILTENLTVQPDIFIQITVPNEFRPIGKFNIGITAGVETTVAPVDFIEGVNRMNLVIVPSEFTKAVLEKTEYAKHDTNTKQIIGRIFTQKPIEVLFEGTNVDLYASDLYSNEQPTSDTLNERLASIDTDFNFLFVGHWLKGDFGQDRKNVGKLISTFYTVFRDRPREEQPGLILKTSRATFSVMDREEMIRQIEEIKNRFDDVNSLPPVYLLHGDLPATDMAALYNHPKVSAHITFTKGEGFGRPLLEASLSGKPVIAPNWSGHIDFLRDRGGILIDGTLTQVHPSAADQFILENSQWFDVNLTEAAKVMIDVVDNYEDHLRRSQKAFKKNAVEFTLDRMTEKFTDILDKYTKTPEQIKIKLPSMENRKKKTPNVKLPKIQPVNVKEKNTNERSEAKEATNV